MTPINLSELLFADEAETEVLRLAANRHLVLNLVYFWQTADTVSEGFDPETRKPITASGLKAWCARCQKMEPPADATSRHPAVRENQDGLVHNAAKTVHPRRPCPLQQYD
jgi:hypothetical protein